MRLSIVCVLALGCLSASDLNIDGTLHNELNADGAIEVKYGSTSTINSVTGGDDSNVKLVISGDANLNIDNITLKASNPCDKDTFLTNPDKCSKLDFDYINSNEIKNTINVANLKLTNKLFYPLNSRINIQNAAVQGSIIHRRKGAGSVTTIDNLDMQNSFYLGQTGDTIIKNLSADSSSSLRLIGSMLQIGSAHSSDDGKIKIEQGSDKTLALGYGCEANDNCLVKDLDIHGTNVGAISINNVKVQDVKILQEKGNITIEGASLQDTKIVQEQGNMTIDNTTLKNLDITKKNGDIELKNGAIMQDTNIVQESGLLKLTSDAIIQGGTIDGGASRADKQYIAVASKASIIGTHLKNANISSWGQKYTTTTELELDGVSMDNVNLGDIINNDNTLSLGKITIKNTAQATKTIINAKSLEVQNSTITSGTLKTKTINASNANIGADITLECADESGCTSTLDSTTISGNLGVSGKSQLNLNSQSTIKGDLQVSKDSTVKLDGNSSITNTIQNDGTIIISNGSISNDIQGSGSLQTKNASYDKPISTQTMKGSNINAKQNVTISSSLEVENGNFAGDVKVQSNSEQNPAKLTAYQGNVFWGDVKADHALLTTTEKTTTPKQNAIQIHKSLDAQNLQIIDANVRANAIKATDTSIQNSNVSATNISPDSLEHTYARDISQGAISIQNSQVRANIRANRLSAQSSTIQGQIAVNELDASDSEFYVYGGGMDTSLYEAYSGAVVVRQRASGKNNTIYIANTNISKLLNGYVPVAVINFADNALENPQSSLDPSLDTPPKSALSKIATQAKSASKAATQNDFVTIKYKSVFATYELLPQYISVQSKSGKYIWSVGIAGDNLLSIDNVDSVLNGDDSIANGAKSAGADYSQSIARMGGVFGAAQLDKKAIVSAKRIANAPRYILARKLDILDERYRVAKSTRASGVWQSSTHSRQPHYQQTDISIGADKASNLEHSVLLIGVLGSVGTAKSDTILGQHKSIGAYLLDSRDDGGFISAQALYHSIDASYSSNLLSTSIDKSHKAYHIALSGGHRFGSDVYVEPSVGYSYAGYGASTVAVDDDSMDIGAQSTHRVSARVELGAKASQSVGTYVGAEYAREFYVGKISLNDQVSSMVIDADDARNEFSAWLGMDYAISKGGFVSASAKYTTTKDYSANAAKYDKSTLNTLSASLKFGFRY